MGDFIIQHTPGWWRNFLQATELLDLETCNELEDTKAIYQELVRYEYENNIGPFDVLICLDQLEWGRTQYSIFLLSVLLRNGQGHSKMLNDAPAKLLFDEIRYVSQKFWPHF